MRKNAARLVPKDRQSKTNYKVWLLQLLPPTCSLQVVTYTKYQGKGKDLDITLLFEYTPGMLTQKNLKLKSGVQELSQEKYVWMTRQGNMKSEEQASDDCFPSNCRKSV